MQTDMLFIYTLFLIIILCHGNISQDIFTEVNPYKEYANKIGEFLKRDIVSQGCREQMTEYGKSLVRKQLWALKLFDAGGKIPSGVLEGNFVELGSFDECLNVEYNRNESETIYGKYCLGDISININLDISQQEQLIKQNKYQAKIQNQEQSTTSMKFKIAVCVPNGCSARELQTFYQYIIQNITISETLCQTKMNQPELDAGGIATISFLGIVLGIMIISTIYDIALFYLQKEKPFHPLLIAFSVLTNGRKLFATTNDSKQISCLHGLRVITTMWVIIGHRYLTQISLPVKNSYYLRKWLNQGGNMFLIQASVSVDTFFFMSGLVISYVYMTSMSKGIKFNVLLYYVHRYLRLTPLLAVILIVYITLLKHLGSGPIWHTTTNPLIESCKNSWWKTLLYIQNYGDLDMCVGQSWYLSADTQLFFLSPILLIPLLKWPRFTMILTGFLVVCNMIICFLTAWYLELSIASRTLNFSKYYYYPTHTRAAPWFIGILFGYLVFQAKHKRKIVLSKV